MNEIITKRQEYFQKIGEYNYGLIDSLILPNKIAFDSETTDLAPRRGEMFCCQIGTGENNYLIDLESYTFKDIQPYLENKVLVGHNLTFDLGWLYKENFYPKEVRDTFIASKLLYNGYPPNFRHGFGYVMERELNLIYDKSEQKNIAKIKLSTKKAIEYCFNDVDKLLLLEEHLEKKHIEQKSIESYQLHCRYIKALAYMEQCGLPLKYDTWKNKIDNDLKEFKEKENKVIEYIWDNLPKYREGQLDMFNTEKTLSVLLSSSKQMLPVFKDFGINVENPEDKTKESIGEDIIKKTKHPFVDIWLELQSITHDLSTYGENILNRIENDTIYTTFNPILDTARISTRKEGINILNFPANEKTRECVQAHKDYQLIVCDYEGQENSVGADLHQDAVMVASVMNGADLHCAFARVLNPELKDLSDEEIVTKHKAKRNAAKSPRFLFSYGGNAFTLHQNENIPIDEAVNIEKAYKELHSGIYEWGTKVFNHAVKVGYIESAMGFKLHLPYFEEFQKQHTWINSLERSFWEDYKIGKLIYKSEQAAGEKKEKFTITNPFAYQCYVNNSYHISKYFKSKSKYFKLCLNNPIQSSSAHQTKLAASMLFEYIIAHNHQGLVKIVNIPHDEFVLEVQVNLVEEYKKVLEDCMINGGNQILTTNLFSMKAKANSGDNWYQAK